MAIKINNNTIINDNRGIVDINNQVGTSGQILTSTGTAIQWSRSGETFVYDSNGTFNKPSTADFALVRLWGGGGSGSLAPTGMGGGGGGFAEKLFPLPDIPPSVPITIGAGGVAVAPGATGATGGNSSFGGLLTAYGGAGGSNPVGGGGGGGSTGAGGPGLTPGPGAVINTSVVTTVTVTYPTPTTGGTTTNYRKGVGSYDAGGRGGGPLIGAGDSFLGGGGGASVSTDPLIDRTAGGSVWGGGGGASPLAGSNGNSLYGGNGGSPTSRNGAIKGGGGASAPTVPTIGQGGPGYCEIYVW